MNDMAERILEYRAKHGLSQEEFANLAQVNVMTINAIENGKRTPLRMTLKKIELVLNEKED